MSPTWQNWAKNERSTPALEVAPRRIEQVQAAMLRARETGHTVKPIGASHSFSAVGATDGIRLRMHRLRGLAGADPATGQVTLWAGTHLWELPAILDPLGLALQNMGDIDRQTLSGAISTGTHGTGNAFGGLASQVTGVTLVTGTGEVLEVHRDGANAELLSAVALGLGALGVLVTVTLQCVPKFLLRARETQMPWEQAIETFFERCDTEDHFEFFWFPHTRSTRTKTNTRLPLEAERKPLSAVRRYLDEQVLSNAVLGGIVGVERVVPALIPRVNRIVQAVASTREYTDDSYAVFVSPRNVRFREMEYALPLEAIPEALRDIRRVIERNRFRVSFPVEVRSAAPDGLLLSTAHDRLSGYIAVHRFFREDPTLFFREVEAVFRAYSGRPHWGKMHTQSRSSLQRLYPRFEEFLAIRDRLDPEGILRNPYLDRVLGAPGTG